MNLRINMESRCSKRNSRRETQEATEADHSKVKVVKESVADEGTVQSACFSASIDCSDEISHKIFEQVLEISSFKFKGILNKNKISKDCRKLEKKKQADEKKRQREEEYRRKLLPRDQKVTLIDRDVLDSLEKFSDLVSNLPRKGSINLLQQNHDDFPALGAAYNKRTREETGKSSFKEHSNCDDLCSCHSMATKQSCKPVAGASIELEKTKATSSKRAHWRNAVKIDLLDIAKGPRSLKQENRNKEKTRVQKNSKLMLCGNPLDSSNPDRKRGKFRENKKAKLSSLKRIIRDELEKRKREKAELDHHSQKVEDKDTFSDLCKHDWDNLFPEVSAHSSGSCKHSIPQKSGLEKTIQHDSDSETVTAVESLGRKEDDKTSTQSILIESSVHNGDVTQVKPKCIVHSRKFREYCDHFVTPEINELASNLIRELLRLQDRQYQRDPIKAHSKRKYVVGLHETRKFLLLKKVKLLIIATDIEKIESAGGLNDLISQLKEAAAVQNVPCVFALQRRKIGYLTLKKSPVSCLGVLNYQACESHVTALLEAVMLARQQYRIASQNCEVDELEPQTDVHGNTDEAVKEIIDSFISLMRSETSTESSASSTPFLYAIEKCDKC